MQKLLILITSVIFLLPTSIIAQNETPSQAKERVKNLMWNSGDTDFNVTQPTEKWKNESAVFLCKKYEYSVKKEMLISFIYENIYSHNRILLLDKSAVENYSTFNFDVSKTTGSFFGYGTTRKVYLGLKVIKPNGAEIMVPIDDNQTDIIAGRSVKKEIQKIAVPNLEPGDILDYYVATESTVMGNYLYYGFSPVLYTMSDEYPVQKQKIIMHIMRKCYLSSISVNGAPQFQILNKQSPRDITWIVEDSDRGKFKAQDFSYPLREEPYIIFQTFFARNLNNNNISFFVEKEDRLKSFITDSDWQTYIKFVQNDISYYYLSQQIEKYWSKHCKKENDPEVLAKKAYYYLREYIYGNDYMSDIANNNFSRGQFNEYLFTKILSGAFKKKKIPHCIVITAPRELCDIKDIIIKPQMGYLIKVNTQNPFYLTSFGPYSTSTVVDHSYQGNSAKAFVIKSNSDFGTHVNDIKIPVDKPHDNQEIQELNVVINPDSSDMLDITQKIIFKGCQKQSQQKEFLSLSDRVKEFEKNRFSLKYNKVKKPSLLYAYKNNLVTDSTERHKKVQDFLKSIYGTEHIALKECRTLQPGIWEDEPDFIFQSKYTIHDFISSTGDNIILNFGQLIGNQYEYDKTDSVRKYNIYTSYPRIWKLNITLPIPEGYKIKGIENLNSHIDNNSGSFITKAELNGNKLEVLVHKEYKANFLPKSEWPFFKEFLDAANDFRNHKIILTRNN